MIKKVSHIFLSFALLATTAGLTINLHYCAGDLYSFAVDSKAANCCDDDVHVDQMDDMEHHNMCHTNGKDMDNCEDETVLVKISDNFTKTAQNISISNNFVIVFFKTLFCDELGFLASLNVETDFYNINNSPPDKRQIHSFYQTFLL